MRYILQGQKHTFPYTLHVSYRKGRNKHVFICYILQGQKQTRVCLLHTARAETNTSLYVTYYKGRNKHVFICYILEGQKRMYALHERPGMCVYTLQITRTKIQQYGTNYMCITCKMSADLSRVPPLYRS